MKITYTKNMAYSAYQYYLENSVDYAEVAAYLSDIFGHRFVADDIGRLFRHIVVWGKNDKLAEDLTYLVNARTKHNTYGKFIYFRRKYATIKSKLDDIELIISEMAHFKKENVEDFISSEDEAQILELCQKTEKKYDTIDWDEYHKLQNDIKVIESYKIGSLL